MSDVPLLSVFRCAAAQVDPATRRQVEIMDYIMTGDKEGDAPHVEAHWNLRELRNVTRCDRAWLNISFQSMISAARIAAKGFP